MVMPRGSTLFWGFVALLCCTVAGLAVTANPNGVPGGWAKGTTGGNGGQEVTVATSEEFNNQAEKAAPMVIRVRGTLTGECSIRSGDKTVLGEPGAVIEGTLKIENVSNVIVRNVLVHITTPCTGTSGPGTCEEGPDAVHIESATRIWLDHLAMLDGNDGNMDFTKAADSITVSWCTFSYTRTGNDHQFSNLIGNADNQPSDSGKFNCTFHHCWWGNLVKERMPRVRYGKVHLYNNLFSSTFANHCIRVGFMADILAESNIFNGVRNPVNYYNQNGKITLKNNVYKNVIGDTLSRGSSFTPWYPYAVEDPGIIEDAIRSQAGNTITSWSTGVISRKKARLIAGQLEPPVRIERRNGICSVINNTATAVAVSVHDLSGRCLISNQEIMKEGRFIFAHGKGVRMIRVDAASVQSMHMLTAVD
ncbi:MAG: hypothetical protein JW768_06625 [Chitinispirillaceae bacterium]|nr:hypothetical protein [Chitinispirillaceae bacterium]